MGNMSEPHNIVVENPHDYYRRLQRAEGIFHELVTSIKSLPEYTLDQAEEIWRREESNSLIFVDRKELINLISKYDQ